MHLLLGGVLLLPYVLLGVLFVQLLRAGASRFVAVLLLGAAVVIAGAPAFLRGTRTLEMVAVRALLDVDLPDLAMDRPAVGARLRSALWFVPTWWLAAWSCSRCWPCCRWR